MWIDVDTHEGMSGSPVYYKSKGIYTDKEGKQRILLNKTTGQEAQEGNFFIGIYSAYYKDINIGMIWKSTFLKTIFYLLP